MKLTRYVCTHCGKKFEAEEKDILECPGCFWSTSVKKEEDVVEGSSVGSDEGKKKSTFLFPSFDWKPAVYALLAVAAVFVVIRVVAPALSKTASSLGSFKISLPKPESKPAKEKPAASPVPAPATIPGTVSLEEKNILARRIQVLPDRPVSGEEQKILDARAPFKTGYSEKLPSPEWSLEGFKELVHNQERVYQVPLPGSYKRKLWKLFEEKYILAAEAFKAGDMMRARNGWVESLAFPVYAGDLQKHRGVVLTMLRPFITDTLSKIGTINSALVEKTIRDKESSIAQAYEKLFPLLQSKAWTEAFDALTNLERMLEDYAHPERLGGGPSEYPADVKLVDQDIRNTLFDLLTVPPPAVADLDPLSRDLFAKKRVVQGFLPASLEPRQVAYNEALEAIDRGQWAAAEKKLKEVDLPEELYRDAQEKIKILKKLQSGPLDSTRKSG